ncbi:MAG: hypothetical protein JXR05_06370 [Flavobacteriaceae bacterium]
MITKEIESKSIVWLQNANQYIVVEKITAKITIRLSNGASVENITRELKKELEIPFEKAKELVMDIQKNIVNPNQKKKESSPHKKTFKKPESFPYVKFYKINSIIFKVEFTNEFELSLIHPKFAHLEINDSSKIDFHFQVFTNNEKTFLVVDNKLIDSWSREVIHYFQGKFSMKIVESIYQKTEDDWMGVFHASAINHKENSILILGDSGNGKSTSLALLQANGFHCIADDFVPVDNKASVHSFPAGISIKRNSLDVLSPFYPELKNSAEFHYKRFNKIVRYLPPKDIDYTKSFPCKALIFIKYNKDLEFTLNPISNSIAFEGLVPDSWISSIPENVTLFLDWFSSLPCYQLTYSNNEKMISAVEKIFEHDA